MGIQIEPEKGRPVHDPETLETNVPGLYVANMFQVYPHDRGQNYSVELAEQLVNKIGA